MKMLIVGLLAAGVMLGQNPPAKGPTLTPGSNITINGSSSTPCSGPNCIIAASPGVTPPTTVKPLNAPSGSLAAMNGSATSLSAVNDFAADATGSANSYTAFTNMAASGKSVYIPAGTYNITGASCIPLSSGTSVWSDAQPTINVTFSAPSSAWQASLFCGIGTFTDYPGTNVANDNFPALINLASGSSGSTTVTCATTGCVPAGTVGTYIMLAEGVSPKWDTFRQYVKVTAVDGTNSVMTLAQGTTWALGTSSTHVGFIRITPLQNVTVSGLTVHSTNSNLDYGLVIELSIGVTVFNNHFMDYYNSAESWILANDDAVYVAGNTYEQGVGGGTNYSTNVFISGNLSKNALAGSEEFGQGAYNVIETGNTYNNWNGVGGHPLVGTGAIRNFVFSGNLINGTGATQSNPIYMSYGDDVTINDNKFLNITFAAEATCTTTPSLSAAIGCRRSQFTNNTVTMSPGATDPCLYAQNASSVANAKIQGNTFVSCGTSEPITVNGGATSTTMSGWSVGGNLGSGIGIGFANGFATGVIPYGASGVLTSDPSHTYTVGSQNIDQITNSTTSGASRLIMLNSNNKGIYVGAYGPSASTSQFQGNAVIAADNDMLLWASGVASGGTNSIVFSPSGYTTPTSKINASGYLPITVYSAAGTAVPTCGGSTAPTNTVVYAKDITALGTNYVSGGTILGALICDGTNWHAF